MKQFRYDAFISYSRTADGKVARAVEVGLKSFAKPLFKMRALRIFRDDASLSANPALWESIQEALAQSRYLVLLASSDSARSKWVDRELRWWFGNRSPSEVIVVLTDGPSIEWERRSLSALPAIFWDYMSSEPRWIDMRWARTETDLSRINPRFLESIADIAAPLHGRPKDELIGDDVTSFRRLRALSTAALGVLSLLVIATTVTASVAIEQRSAAEEAEHRARVEREAAVAARDLANKAQAIAEDEKRKALLILGKALDNLGMLELSVTKRLYDEKVPRSVRLDVLRTFEAAVWPLTEDSTAAEIGRTMFPTLMEHISATYHNAGLPADALRVWERNVRFRRAEAAANPRNSISRWRLALSLQRLASHRLSVNDLAGHRTALSEALKEMDRVGTSPYVTDGPAMAEGAFRKLVSSQAKIVARELESSLGDLLQK